jgi:serine protease Do
MPFPMNQPRRSLRIATAVLLLGSAAGIGGLAWSSGSAPPAVAATRPLPVNLAPVVNQAGFADLVEQVEPAVVQIATTSEVTAQQIPNLPDDSPFGDMLKQFFGQNGEMFQQNATPQHALGSGFIIDPAGYIVTNNHVIDGAHDIKVTLTDGNNYTAKLVGRDAKTDLALLKIDAGRSLPYVSFGDSGKERVGDWVIAVGNPYGLGGTVTAGIVSAKGRNINEGAYDNFLQIDAPINPGNSGGPLFDQSGHVVGVDTAIYSPSGGSVGIGFAIPSNLVSNVVAQLRAHGQVERGWLGIAMQPLTPALASAIGLADDKGVLVDQVEKDSPASRALLKQGDVITGFNGMAIEKPRDLAIAVANAPQGKMASMTIWRDHEKRTVEVTIAAQKQEDVAAAGNGDEQQQGPIGMSLEPLTASQRETLGLTSSTQGVVVAQVRRGGPADQSGVQAGDVILKVGGEQVKTPSQAANAIHAAEQANKSAVPLLIARNGNDFYLGLQLSQG